MTEAAGQTKETETLFNQLSPEIPAGDFASLDVGILLGPNFDERLQEVKADRGRINWILAAFSLRKEGADTGGAGGPRKAAGGVTKSKVLHFCGAGGIAELGVCLEKCRETVAVGLIRVGFGTGRFCRMKWVSVQYTGSGCSLLTRRLFLESEKRLERSICQGVSITTPVASTELSEFALERVIERVRRCAVIDSGLEGGEEKGLENDLSKESYANWLKWYMTNEGRSRIAGFTPIPPGSSAASPVPSVGASTAAGALMDGGAGPRAGASKSAAGAVRVPEAFTSAASSSSPPKPLPRASVSGTAHAKAKTEAETHKPSTAGMVREEGLEAPAGAANGKEIESGGGEDAAPDVPTEIQPAPDVQAEAENAPDAPPKANAAPDIPPEVATAPDVPPQAVPPPAVPAVQEAFWDPPSMSHADPLEGTEDMAGLEGGHLGGGGVSSDREEEVPLWADTDVREKAKGANGHARGPWKGKSLRLSDHALRPLGVPQQPRGPLPGVINGGQKPEKAASSPPTSKSKRGSRQSHRVPSHAAARASSRGTLTQQSLTPGGASASPPPNPSLGVSEMMTPRNSGRGSSSVLPSEQRPVSVHPRMGTREGLSASMTGYTPTGGGLPSLSGARQRRLEALGHSVTRVDGFGGRGRSSTTRIGAALSPSRTPVAGGGDRGAQRGLGNRRGSAPVPGPSVATQITHSPANVFRVTKGVAPHLSEGRSSRLQGSGSQVDLDGGGLLWGFDFVSDEENDDEVRVAAEMEKLLLEGREWRLVNLATGGYMEGKAEGRCASDEEREKLRRLRRMVFRLVQESCELQYADFLLKKSGRARRESFKRHHSLTSLRASLSVPIVRTVSKSLTESQKHAHSQEQLPETNETASNSQDTKTSTPPENGATASTQNGAASSNAGAGAAPPVSAQAERSFHTRLQLAEGIRPLIAGSSVHTVTGTTGAGGGGQGGSGSAGGVGVRVADLHDLWFRRFQCASRKQQPLGRTLVDCGFDSLPPLLKEMEGLRVDGQRSCMWVATEGHIRAMREMQERSVGLGLSRMGSRGGPQKMVGGGGGGRGGVEESLKRDSDP
uniref:Uncharacterized protein n=1 Tax=Chromera velia CCMP2878 TaxID=1169474 RepID=A0A0G4G321_9ALVE|eukprot:Cvel_20031.t1-p1 / transcript=Cvel_20031.t1 / gene=Cvel_20031 / organism=Chromera_velia_CCMP2878 / gene_product=hypothetical protein / transcript_product=hypothetical protein / location=Cvel_scaffold1769:8111-14895(-) / protein_length=1069 / sequence_SO=supercontig / SO=protein_coding / is_pseudo=false